MTKITELLKNVTTQNLQPEWIGSLETKRAQCIYKNGMICLDKSNYFQQTDYEVEYEVSDRSLGEQHFKALLLQHNIQIKEAPSKIARFHTYKNQIKKED